MSIEEPIWLNKNFLKTALEDGDEFREIDVINFEVRRAVPKGNNYICDILRAKVDYKIKNSDKFTKYLIIKTPIKGGLNDFMFNFGIVQREVLVYREFLPKLCDLLGDENEYLTAKSYQSIEENVIVMDDLNEAGFKMANRLEQLDFDHTVVALKHLAKYHAASVKLHEKYPELIVSIGKELMFRKDLQQSSVLAKGPIEMFGIELSTWPVSKEFVDSINKLIDVSFDKLTDCVECKENDFNVLNHGDLWVANMLYKYDKNGRPIKVKFVDLQISRFASPALDLIYLFNGSVQEDVRTSKYEELINIYVDALNDNLKTFSSKKSVTASEIIKAVEKRQYYAFYVNITLLPTVIQDTNTIMEMKEMSENDINDLANNPFRKYMQTENFRRLFLKRIKEFDNVVDKQLLSQISIE